MKSRYSEKHVRTHVAYGGEVGFDAEEKTLDKQSTKKKCLHKKPKPCSDYNNPHPMPEQNDKLGDILYM
jgi:hypothetical protein